MAKYDAFGTELYRGTSGAGTAIAQVQSIGGPGLSRDTIDSTAIGDTWEQVLPSILRSGEITLEILYDPANATHKNASGGLLYDLEQGTSTTYTLVFPDAATTEWAFSAYVIGFEPNAPHDGALTAGVTLKPSGDMTLV